MRTSIVRALFLFVFAFPAIAHAADLPSKFDPARDAAADVAHAVAIAKAQGKRVIVDVGGEWCTWCHIMDRFIAANDNVRSLIDAHYVWVKVNYSKQNPNDALLARWPKVAGYPHLFVLDAHYVWVKVNYSKQNPNEALLARWPKVAGYPHRFVLDASGDHLFQCCIHPWMRAMVKVEDD